MKKTIFGRSQKLYKKAKKLIPGGTQLLSKRPEMHLPEYWPAYYSRAKGCEVWDLDGKKYVDMSYMGIGSCLIGYADDDINRAVKSAVEKGSMNTLNAPEEVELAELLMKLHPWARMVRYARSGGEAMSQAVRIARAKTGRDIVLFCGYHGWHDWYLSSNLADRKSLDGHLLPGLSPHGVPRALKGTSYPFNYNNTKQFLGLMRKYGKNTGAVILESIRNSEPEKEFVTTIRRETKKRGIVLIVDEITAGFRLNAGGAHMLYGLKPDIAVFAKGISNGFPMAAILGTGKVMEVAQGTFISSTYWTDRIGPSAAVATIKKFMKFKVHKHLVKMGKMVQNGWQKLARDNGLEIHVGGMYPLGHFSFTHKKPLVLKTLFTQFMLVEGILATTAFYASYAHKEKHVRKYLEAVNRAFRFISKAVKTGKPEKFLAGPVCHSGFKRLT
ncbi:MAG: aminotransferase class III-fold pyridoxal phosphate-dependent enzyme [Endomicrobiales bacterium]|nr:aminotransferase class III-fold pyridoxal phosphate-dependent enzyme [Endomicrobiales bacterium]